MSDSTPSKKRVTSIHNSDLTIDPVRSRADKREFVHFPWKIYRGEFGNYPAWVPPLLVDEKHNLDSKKNAFYRHSHVEHFLARRNGRVVGRISAIYDQLYNSHHESSTGFFGFFEAPQEQEIANALLDTAKEWIREKGATSLIGPVNLSTNHIIGCLMNDFDKRPVIQMAYNPPYYPTLFETHGLRKYKDLYSYRLDTSTLPLSDKIRRVQEISRKRSGVTMRYVTMKKDWNWVVPTIRSIYNEAWSDNWGFVPWTEDEFAELAEGLKLIVSEDLVLIAEINGEPVGFAIAMPDINTILKKMNGRLFPTGLFRLLAGRRKLDFVRVAAMGVRPAHHNKGIDAVLIYELWTRGTSRGVKKGEFSWILEDNLDLRNLLEAWGTELYRTHRIYGKEL